MPKPLRLSLSMKLLGILLTLTVVPLVVIAVASDVILVQAAETEASRLGLGSLAQTQYLGDSLTNLVIRICTAVATDPRTDGLAATNHLQRVQGDSEVSYAFMAYQNDLESRVKAESVILKIKVQFQDADYTTDTVEGTYPRTDFADHSLDGSAGWVVENPLTYRYPVPQFLTRHPGWIEVTLDEGALSRHLNPPSAAGRVAIASLSGTVVSHPDKSRIGTRLSWVPSADQGTGSRVIDGDSGRTLQTWSHWSGPWLWVGEYPLDVLTQGANQRRAVTLSLALGLFVATLLVAYFVSRRIARPIRALAARVRTPLPTEGPMTSDGLQILARAFEALQARENRLFRASRQNANWAYETWLNHVLDGNTASVPPGAVMGTHFQCLLILIDSFDAFLSAHDAATRQALQRVLLQATLLALPRHPVSCRAVLRGEGRLAVVFDGPADAPPLSADHTEPLAREVSQWFGTTLTFCFGERLPGIDGLVRSWSQAQDLVEVRFLQGSGRTYLFESGDPPGNYQPLPMVLIQRVLVALESGRPDELTAPLEKVAQHIRAYPGRGEYRAGLFQLASALQTWMSENGLSEDAVFERGGPRLFEIISSSETLEAACRGLEDHCKSILAWRSALQGQRKDHIQRVLDFIWENYRQDCGIDTVAAGVGLSYSHVRRVFADHVGETIVTFVNRIRVDDARHLLQNTSMSLDEIAVAVGFRNTQSLQRYFRSLAGTSPGEYRKSHAEASLS